MKPEVLNLAPKEAVKGQFIINFTVDLKAKVRLPMGLKITPRNASFLKM